MKALKEGKSIQDVAPTEFVYLGEFYINVRLNLQSLRFFV